MGLLLFVVVICHIGGLVLARFHGSRKATMCLYLFCGIQLLLLAYFKYTGFFMDQLLGVAKGFGISPTWTTVNIILPVGISFYIFQAISYLVGVFRGVVKPEANFIRMGVYLGFFPHLVAGPIIHAASFLPQLSSRRRFDSGVFLEGWRKFAIGFLYKSVFADNLAGPVDAIFRDPAAYSPISVFGGCLGFYGQIYFDFAGYSLMAIGVANMFGYFIPDNFNHPYRAASVVDFWRRWHISLSTWLRDYLYIPLGGNRGPRWMVYRNLFITMFLGGLWHGASWNFVVWGVLHGMALCLNHAWNESSSAVRLAESRTFKVFSLLATQAFVFLCWVPFRSQSFADTLLIFQKLASLAASTLEASKPFPWLLALLPLMADTFLVGQGRWAWRSNPAFYVVLAVSFLVGLLFMHIGFAPFIYFQF